MSIKQAGAEDVDATGLVSEDKRLAVQRISR